MEIQSVTRLLQGRPRRAAAPAAPAPPLPFLDGEQSFLYVYKNRHARTGCLPQGASIATSRRVAGFNAPSSSAMPVLSPAELLRARQWSRSTGATDRALPACVKPRAATARELALRGD